MLYAGRLQPIEEALAMLAGNPAPAPPSRPGDPAPPAPATPKLASHDSAGAWVPRLASALRELGLAYTADAIEHSEVTAGHQELRFVTPREYRLSMKEAEIRKALAKLGAPALKIEIQFVESAAPAQAVATLEGSRAEDELARRALEHPEVKRFREIFGGHVRAVRNLKQ
jgi:hypothetical protein